MVKLSSIYQQKLHKTIFIVNMDFEIWHIIVAILLRSITTQIFIKYQIKKLKLIFINKY